MIICDEEKTISFRKLRNRIYFDTYYSSNKMTLWFKDFTGTYGVNTSNWKILNEKFCRRMKQELPG